MQLPLYMSALEFEISSLMNLILNLFQTWILQAIASRKIQLKLGKISTLTNSIFQTRECQKSSAYRYRGLGKLQFNMYIEVFFVSITLSSNNTVGVVKYLWNDHFVT